MTQRSDVDSIEILAQDLLAECDKTAGRFLLGITGPPGAGKSTLAENLREELQSRFNFLAAVVPMDGYHLDDDTLKSMGIHHLKGIEKSFDGDGYVELLKCLKETDHDVPYPTFDRTIESTVENGGMVPASVRLVITEGNYLLSENAPWHQIRCMLDRIWYVDVDEDVLLPRLISRHVAGGKTIEQARAKVHCTDLPNAKHVASTKELANRIMRF